MPFKLKSNNRTSNKMTQAKWKFHPSCCPKIKWYRVFLRIYDWRCLDYSLLQSQMFCATYSNDAILLFPINLMRRHLRNPVRAWVSLVAACALLVTLTAAKAGPYRLDGRRQLDYCLLIFPIDGMERGSGQFFNFFAAALPSSDKLPNIKLL